MKYRPGDRVLAIIHDTDEVGQPMYIEKGKIYTVKDISFWDDSQYLEFEHTGTMGFKASHYFVPAKCSNEERTRRRMEKLDAV